MRRVWVVAVVSTRGRARPEFEYVARHALEPQLILLITVAFAIKLIP
jgi:hypothetical protein|tara:strand:- start:251 stop:391 length:141 start_codon:yes stop_codon:yes gene_type:complete